MKIDAEELPQLRVVAAAVALHALISARHPPIVALPHRDLIAEAFTIADEFLKQAQL
jgi:hypothetical protein